jgi:hypothetical protein
MTVAMKRNGAESAVKSSNSGKNRLVLSHGQ